MVNEKNNNERKYQRGKNAAYLIKANTHKREKKSRKEIVYHENYINLI